MNEEVNKQMNALCKKQLDIAFELLQKQLDELSKRVATINEEWLAKLNAKLKDM